MNLPPIIMELTKGENCPTVEQAAELFANLTSHTMRKNEILQDIGIKCRKMYFIKKGIVKTSIVDSTGAQHTVRFVGKGDGVTVIDSFIYQTPSTLRLQCVVPGEVLTLKYDDYVYMTQLYKGLENSFLKLLLARKNDMLQERFIMTNQDALTKYTGFKERHAPIVDLLPLKDVASYLGIRQQSLSRLRAKM